MITAAITPTSCNVGYRGAGTHSSVRAADAPQPRGAMLDCGSGAKIGTLTGWRGSTLVPAIQTDVAARVEPRSVPGPRRPWMHRKLRHPLRRVIPHPGANAPLPQGGEPIRTDPTAAVAEVARDRFHYEQLVVERNASRWLRKLKKYGFIEELPALPRCR